jgi:NADPH2:quinone reductase
MPRAIRIHETGGPEVMLFEDVEVGAPAMGEVQLRHTAIGLNFIDVYDRSGLYPQKSLPAGLGREAAGVVTAVGKKVRGFKIGDRVAYVHNVPGSYSELRNVPIAPLVKIPAGVSDEQAAVLMLKGLTVGYLLRHTHKAKRGDVVVLHAAAGGLGLMLSQWAKALGVTVIGIVGNDEKAKLARKNGCKHVLVRGRDDIVTSVRKLTPSSNRSTACGGADTWSASAMRRGRWRRSCPRSSRSAAR